MHSYFSKIACVLCLILLGQLILNGSDQLRVADAADSLVQKVSSFRNQEGDYTLSLDRNTVGMTAGGSVSCAGCHGQQFRSHQEQSGEVNSDGIGEIRPGVDAGWVKMNERITFQKYDKHFQAYAALKTEEAKKMAEILGVQKDGKSIIHTDTRCLACHSTVPVEHLLHDFESTLISEKGYQTLCITASKDKNTNGKSAVDLLDTKLKLGVSCEACHGASGEKRGKNEASDLKGWRTLHYGDELIRGKSKKWRYLTNQEKHQHGYKDVRGYVNRTKVCASCHIGNYQEGKVVTHEMYAAGHPPLPNLEVASYSNQEPMHWNSFYQKKPAMQKKWIEKSLLWEEGNSADIKELKNVADQTTLMMVAGMIAMAEQLRLTVDLVKEAKHSPFQKVFAEKIGEAKKTDDALYHWPEFANYACFNCHHDLKVTSWRRDRIPILKPGRPNLHEWSFANVELGFKYLKQEDLFEKEWKPLFVKALDKSPFGDKKLILETYPQLADRLEEAAQKIAKNPITVEELPTVMVMIAHLGEAESRDYDSTRQLVWAFSIAYDEYNLLKHKTPMPIHRSEPQSKPGVKLEPFDGWYDQNSSNDPISKLLGEFSKSISLNLNKKRSRERQPIQLDSNHSTTLNLYKLSLSGVFNEISRYEANQLKKTFHELGNLAKELK